MSSTRLIIAGALLVTRCAYAAEPDACYAPPPSVDVDDALTSITVDDPDTVIFEVGQLEAQLGEQPSASMTGGVLLRQGDRLAGADEAVYEPVNQSLLLDGQVRFEDPNSHVESDSAEFSYGLGRIRFEGASFLLFENNGRGAADRLEINQAGRLELDDVSYTTCPPESDDWVIRARDIDLDTREGVGTAKGVSLRFQGVPILYSPYLSFPIGDARKTGVLTPEVGSSSRSGNEIRVPFYWNIAPNYDATITPRLLTDRGWQIGSQFRYLTNTMDGEVYGEYLGSDNKFNDSRSMIRVQHRTLFEGGWRNLLHFQEVSDNQYFEDLGGSLTVSSITHLDRRMSFDYHTDTWSLFGQVQDFQTIDEAIQPIDEPYQRLPQLLVNGYWPDRWLGAQLGIEGELVNFDRDVGVTGWRLNVAPQLALPLSRNPGWFITPAVTLDHTRYDLDNTDPGEDAEPSRTVPISSIDVGLILERDINGGATNRVMTLEPRMLYVHIPERDQDDLPVFDTITPDLNLVSLYRTNRYLGVDRIADTDQVSVGMTSRILDTSSGRELVTATIGQTRYLSVSRVTLPDEPQFIDDSSDYIAEVRFGLSQNLNFDVGHQWGQADRGTTQSQARLQYRPATNKILNVSYRFRRDSLEQGDISWSWPIAEQWNIVGRYKYSFREEEALEEFVGVEYESCCWGLRLVSRRHISTRDGTRDSSIGLQLVLKGLSSVGTAADKMLERGILGYSANLR
ncbi:MAG: LPS assembly protein LptD [Woeseiaceae bacterium]|nr:LPS assembly protein LptD [Woeseiaceae bacterium]